MLVATSETPAGANSEIVCTQVRIPVSSVDNGPADRTIAGTLCRPSWQVPDTVQLLVHGATYNRIAWDWPENPTVYSYVRAAANAGYATLSVDRIGHGASTRPPSADVSIPTGTTALHGVVTSLRAGTVGGHAFRKVVWVGHSLGAVHGYEYGGRYSDIDAYVFTGSIHFMKPSWLNLVQSSLQPAGPDNGYLTTIPGTRDELFYHPAMADPTVIAKDEATKDTVTGAEVQTGLALVNVAAEQSPTRQIRVPVLVALGEFDNLVCGGPDGITCTKNVILDLERPYFANSPRVDAVTVSGSGHMLSQHTNAPAAHWAVLNWIGQIAPPR